MHQLVPYIQPTSQLFYLTSQQTHKNKAPFVQLRASLSAPSYEWNVPTSYPVAPPLVASYLLLLCCGLWSLAKSEVARTDCSTVKYQTPSLFSWVVNWVGGKNKWVWPAKLVLVGEAIVEIWRVYNIARN